MPRERAGELRLPQPYFVPEIDDDDDDEEDEEAEDHDISDRDFAPGNDADYFMEEDDEGRFFGGGLTDEQKNILSIFENAQGDEDAASWTG